MKEELRNKISKATIEAMKNPTIRLKMSIAKKGKPSLRKGSHFTEEQKIKCSLAHKGQIPWNKGRTNLPKQTKEQIKKRVDKMMGNMNPSWKGDSVGYGGVHSWIRNTYGKAIYCENKTCTYKNPKRYEWANISGKYLRDRTDYIMLCKSCHCFFDKGILILFD